VADGNPVRADLHGIAVSLKSGFPIALRSLFALVSAFVVAVLVNLGGGELADTTGFPDGGEARLAWDLGWVFIAGVFATLLVVKLAVAALAVIQLGGDWPRWFSAGILLAVPLQVGLGAGWALRGSKRA
jgi:hypothetical protein